MEFNRIAGPITTPGVYNGVLIARLNTDVALTDFEIAVRDLVSNVENAYWDLYFGYRVLDARRSRPATRRSTRGGRFTRCTKSIAAAAKRRRKPRPASSISASSKTCKTR